MVGCFKKEVKLMDELCILNSNALVARLESLNYSLCEYSECCSDTCGDCMDCCTKG